MTWPDVCLAFYKTTTSISIFWSVWIWMLWVLLIHFYANPSQDLTLIFANIRPSQVLMTQLWQALCCVIKHVVFSHSTCVWFGSKDSEGNVWVTPGFTSTDVLENLAVCLPCETERDPWSPFFTRKVRALLHPNTKQSIAQYLFTD